MIFALVTDLFILIESNFTSQILVVASKVNIFLWNQCRSIFIFKTMSIDMATLFTTVILLIRHSQ